jgi:hypothetical protein
MRMKDEFSDCLHYFNLCFWFTRWTFFREKRLCRNGDEGAWAQRYGSHSCGGEVYTVHLRGSNPSRRLFTDSVSMTCMKGKSCHMMLQVLMAVKMSMLIFWVLTQHRLAGRYHCFTQDGGSMFLWNSGVNLQVTRRYNPKDQHRQEKLPC